MIMRPVTIEPAMNGFVVRVGCQVLVFDDLDIMLLELREYCMNPQEKEKEYIDATKPWAVGPAVPLVREEEARECRAMPEGPPIGGSSAPSIAPIDRPTQRLR